uniref:glutaminase n=1 Tax=Electrophorus electricus TaxID=8005 RepID=A0A4W4ETQ7_ELEEL
RMEYFTGLLTSDPRLRDCMENLRQAVQESVSELLDRCVGGNIVLLSQAFRKKFIIPEFLAFVVADYVPHLAKFSPNLWGMSIYTADGQRHSVDNTKVPLCLQTVHVHRFVSKEPRGFKFNKLSLDEDSTLTPILLAGAIVISSLIKVKKNALIAGVLCLCY